VAIIKALSVRVVAEVQDSSRGNAAVAIAEQIIDCHIFIEEYVRSTYESIKIKTYFYISAIFSFID